MSVSMRQFFFTIWSEMRKGMYQLQVTHLRCSSESAYLPCGSGKSPVSLALKHKRKHMCKQVRTCGNMSISISTRRTDRFVVLVLMLMLKS